MVRERCLRLVEGTIRPRGNHDHAAVAAGKPCRIWRKAR